ncbi:aminopeptidase P family protein [Gryllotalpicola protaetiae]|uniref:Xaa-Pro aminopeptidase n=2 Tax=Gryllotalpicola protaetiae TaxID=2419771 RepID=A0A387BNG0_9MICO|nr:aminopeptidase P family protein [Gryllotalpicola protaetiae]
MLDNRGMDTSDALTTTKAPRATSNRSTLPPAASFKEYIGSQWAERADVVPPAREQAAFAAARRVKLAALYPGKRLIVPAGGAKVRSNDTDYPFRAHSAFSWLTGWAADAEPDSVLVIESADDSDELSATLYFRERAGRDSDEFYSNPQIGEFWIGARPSLAQVAGDLAIATAGIADAGAVVASADENTLVLREADAELTAAVDAARGDAADIDLDAQLARDLSELRLVKDAYEVAEMRAAVASTKRGFEDVIRALPQITAHERGERIVEGVFYARARGEGNAVGYDTIAASGPHACVLHWTRNDGPVVPGDLILIDAGVEAESLYTADITRTLPVSGTFSEPQRLVYETVREAADAAFAVARPGVRFRDVHAAAMAVIARRTAEWGLLPVTAEEALEADGQQHRRYMVHGTSHHLGIDVHDCAAARRELYQDGILEPGMVFTIEPGLYFQPDDLTVPDHLRGIGVRIEDDVVVTESGVESLSAGIPRTADEVEAWIAELRS